MTPSPHQSSSSDMTSRFYAVDLTMSIDARSNEKLEQIFRTVFELPEHTDVSSLRQINAPGWDSLAHVSLIAAIESEFATEIDAGDALRITSFRAAQAVLDERGL